MNLVPNAGSVAWRSAAVRVAYILAAIGVLIQALPAAPHWIQDALPVQNIIDTWNWLSGIVTAIGVQLARVVQQDSLSGGSS